MDILQIDKNLDTRQTFDRDGLTYYSTECSPFRIYGLLKEDGVFRRMPKAVADSVNERVAFLNNAAAGGRIRFATDSRVVAVSVYYNGVARNPLHALCGTAGLDLYSKTASGFKREYLFAPPLDVVDSFDGIKRFSNTDKKDLLINLPTYSGIKAVYIGIEKTAHIYPASEYSIKKPVVFYGSSITQGSCASRPGNAYTALLSAHFDFDYINLGFSGNAKGDPEMADYIAGLDMSALVYDYDYNAPTPQHLRATHRRMFETIRSRQPDLPILMLSRPNPYLSGEETERREIVRETYEAAKNGGDKNVWFIPGDELILPLFRDTTLVDYAHPNDSGFVSMAEVIKPIMRQMLKK